MTTPIDITAEQQKIIFALLQKHLPNTTVWVYGSRIHGTANAKSDLDLVVFAAPEQKLQVFDLKEAFAESNLPFRVDLFSWSELPENFQNNIKAQHVCLTDLLSQALSPDPVTHDSNKVSEPAAKYKAPRKSKSAKTPSK